MVNYVLVLPRKLRKMAEQRGHRVFCFERLPCLSIPPSNSEAHRFRDMYPAVVRLFYANPDEALLAFQHFLRILPQEEKDWEAKIEVTDVWINKWPYGPCYGETQEDDKTTLIDCMEFYVYGITIGDTTVFFEVEIEY